METEIAIKKTEPMTVAFIPMTGPYSQIDEAFGRLYGWLQQKGYAPSGPPMGVYFNSPDQVPAEELAWELRSPISGEVPASDPDAEGAGVKRLEEAEVVATIHKGPFYEVGRTYAAIVVWMMENGYEAAGPSEEVYLTNPAETPPEETMTEVRFPVRKAPGPDLQATA